MYHDDRTKKPRLRQSRTGKITSIIEKPQILRGVQQSVLDELLCCTQQLRANYV
jgi:hypothetical protein